MFFVTQVLMIILDIDTDNMDKRRSADGIHEHALPLPVQMFLWQQLRYATF